MNAKSSKKKSGTDWKFLASQSDQGIDVSDIPRLGPEFWRKAVPRMPRPKDSVTIRLDHDLVKWLKSLGRGYQTRINAVLRSYMQTMKRT